MTAMLVGIADGFFALLLMNLVPAMQDTVVGIDIAKDTFEVRAFTTRDLPTTLRASDGARLGQESRADCGSQQNGETSLCGGQKPDALRQSLSRKIACHSETQFIASERP